MTQRGAAVQRIVTQRGAAVQRRIKAQPRFGRDARRIFFGCALRYGSACNGTTSRSLASPKNAAAKTASTKNAAAKTASNGIVSTQNL